MGFSRQESWSAQKVRELLLGQKVITHRSVFTAFLPGPATLIMLRLAHGVSPSLRTHSEDGGCRGPQKWVGTAESAGGKQAVRNCHGHSQGREVARSWSPLSGLKGVQPPLPLRQTQRSPEGPRHLHRIPRVPVCFRGTESYFSSI